MRYKLLGSSGLRVSELALGTMTFGETWGWGASKEDSRRQFDLYADAGGNFIDTSINYTDGTSEEFVGEFLEGRREHFVVATKFTLTNPKSTDPNSGGNSRKNLMQSVERSLKRLRTDYIDVLYVHVYDFMTPIEEIMRGFDDLVRQGKIAYPAISDSPSYMVAEANTRAELRGYASPVALQVPYSLMRRDVERELLPTAKHWDMTVLAWGVTGGGVLTGKYTEAGAQTSDEPTRYDRDRTTANMAESTKTLLETLAQIAQETEHSRAQVAINWVRQQTARAQIIPIIGARKPEHMIDNIAALEWKLTDDQLKRLDDASAIDYGFPWNFSPGNPYVYGATFDMIDHHRA